MCERTCPKCGSNKHYDGFAMMGRYLQCEGCGAILAHKFDSQAAPLDCADPEQYARERSFVIAGAQAADPTDDEAFAVPLEGK